MTKDEFNKLDIAEQVEYINDKIREGYSVAKSCKEMSIARTTVTTRFSSNNYIKDDKTGMYVSMIEVVGEVENSSLEAKPKPIIEPTKQKSSGQVVMTESQQLMEMMSNYEDNINRLNEMYSWYKLQSSGQVVMTDRLNIDDFNGDLVTRSYKLYEDIQKDFAEFCKRNNKYKVQDILSQALKEFIEKYN